MFKGLTRGYRSAKGSVGSGRIGGLNNFTGTTPLHPNLPPFQTMDPREHGQDSRNSRVSEPGEDSQGYTGGNIGAR